MTRPHDYTPVIPGTEGWTDDMLRRPDRKLEDSFRLEPEPETRPEPARSSVEDRLDHLEKMHQLLWKAIHELQPVKDE